MDSYSILDQGKPPSGGDLRAAEDGSEKHEPESDMAQMSAGRSLQGSVSAAIAVANGVLGATGLTTRASPENAGHSVAEMAQRDLDAALQLLAERAQYITGAGGAAIALRRAGFDDMLCRASTGPNAPELGALLSAEFGLSGESVRTRLPLRCDDAERDSRVNREGCRQLGIASVAVMPIVSDDEVLGVFELFSGKVNAFEERDLSALQRLGEMVETAVRLARTAQTPPIALGEFVAEVTDIPDLVAETGPGESAPQTEATVAKETEAAPASAPQSEEPAVPQVVIKKPLFWSAPSQSGTNSAETDRSHLPAVLRNLHKCQACGFPVSEGRKLCVECEEKQWRGQLRSTPQITRQKSATGAATAPAVVAPAPVPGVVVPTSLNKPAQPAINMGHAATAPQTAAAASPAPSNLTKESVKPSASAEVIKTPANTLPFLSAGGSSSESWLSANKYLVAAILVVAVVFAVIALLR